MKKLSLMSKSSQTSFIIFQTRIDWYKMKECSAVYIFIQLFKKKNFKAFVTTSHHFFIRPQNRWISESKNRKLSHVYKKLNCDKIHSIAFNY